MRLTFRKVKQERFWDNRAKMKAYLDGVEFLTLWAGGNGCHFVIRIQTDRCAEDITKHAPCPWEWTHLSTKFYSLEEAKTHVKLHLEHLFEILATSIKENIKAAKK